MKTILETARLALREMSLDDLDFVAAMLGHPEVMRFYPKIYSRDEAREWVERQLARYARDGHGLWLVEDRATTEPVGQVGLLMQLVDGVEEPEIGYLIHRPFWRRGLATEAALGVRAWAFETQGHERVISLIRPENLPSQGVARKLGMAPEKRAQHFGMEHIVFAVRRTIDLPSSSSVDTM
jgi:ribosomal-protein-alanine N-acetyltransferase